MKQKTFLQTVLIFSFLFNFFLLHAQHNKEIYVKPLKQTYEWNEKVTIEFAGLPQRDAYSGRVDDIIVVPAGTPDGGYGVGERVWVSKPNGQVEFLIPKAVCMKRGFTCMKSPVLYRPALQLLRFCRWKKETWRQNQMKPWCR